MPLKGAERAEYNRKYHLANRQHRINRQLIQRYGINIERYEAMVIERDGRCDICKEKAKLVIDHCHINKEVRGLLCHNCNLGIGHFKDSEQKLRNSITYLKEYRMKIIAKGVLPNGYNAYGKHFPREEQIELEVTAEEFNKIKANRNIVYVAVPETSDKKAK